MFFNVRKTTQHSTVKSKDLDCLRKHYTRMYIIHKGRKEEIKRERNKGGNKRNKNGDISLVCTLNDLINFLNLSLRESAFCLTYKEALTMLCSVVKHAGSG